MLTRAKVEAPSVESLIVVPLSKFVKCSTTECGYTGTRQQHIANWVHPLCLTAKTEASKSDNPN